MHPTLPAAGIVFAKFLPALQHLGHILKSWAAWKEKIRSVDGLVAFATGENPTKGSESTTSYIGVFSDAATAITSLASTLSHCQAFAEDWE